MEGGRETTDCRVGAGGPIIRARAEICLGSPPFEPMQVSQTQPPLRLPDAAGRAEIERIASAIEDPVARLRYIRACAEQAARLPEITRRGPFRSRGDRIVALAQRSAESGSIGSLSLSDRMLLITYRLWVRWETWRSGYRLRRLAPLGAAAALSLVWGVSSDNDLTDQGLSGSPSHPPVVALEEAGKGEGLEVWLVETAGETELYSNGLEVHNERLAHSEPRRYAVLNVGPGLDINAAWERADWRSKPAGVMYHTTVSDTVPPLERSQNQLIRDRSDRLLGYIAREKLYNFVIDRFGRVWRLIPESEVAYHAGYSMWQSAGEHYFNLNDSFIAIGFESRPEAVEPGVRPEVAITPAQIRAAKLLTEMLRERFGISEANCVAHEMVSLNPDNYRIGYHTDWLGRFPYESIGLSDNYLEPPTAVADWGFTYDDALVATLGGEVWPGMKAAARRFAADARSRGLSKEELRRSRRQTYMRLLSKLRQAKSSMTGVPTEGD